MKWTSTFIGAALAVALAVGQGAQAQTDGNPFERAIKQDNAQGVQALLDKGVDPNIKDKRGQPGLIMALHEGSFKAARALADSPKLRVDLTNDAGETALMMAAYTDQIDIAQTLIANGAMINKPGWSPLHYAASKGLPDMIVYLLSRGADIEAQSPNGTTPLMMAAGYGTGDAVRQLLKSGADIGKCNQVDMTALDFAQQYQRPDAIRILTQAGQDKGSVARACPAFVPASITPPASQ
jgi:ankyrin repeat protein